MKGRILTIWLVSLLVAATATVVWADKPIATDEHGNEIAWQATNCRKIQSGEIVGSDGSVVTVGYNEWGYNYQAHMFNGMWCNYHPLYRPGGAYYEWCMENMANVELVMKWNDAWLANVDCDDDFKLDRHYPLATYIGSGAWETNHESGEYALDDGTICKYTYFVKIIAVPADATLTSGVWYNADGTEIGAAIWGDFAIIQEVYNDPCGGYSGLLYLSADHAGFGGW